MTSNWWAITPVRGGGNTVAIDTSSTAAGALGQGVGRYKLTALTANVYIRFGESTMSAASTADGGFDDVIPAGSSVVYSLPPGTYFRAIGDGSGTLVINKVGN